MAIKAIINNTEKEIEQIKNSNEQDIDYVYSRIGDTEVEGTPPISIKSIGGELADYRIYVQTVDGESVGDRTANLFDVSTITLGCYINDEGQIIQNNGINTSDFIKVSPNTNYTYKGAVIYDANIIRITYYDQSKNFISRYFTPGNAANGETITTPSNCEYVKLSYDNAITNLMFNLGSTPLPYEPYGYKVPVTVEGKNLLQNTATSTTKNGVTFTVNSDGSVTCNGTANATAWFDINRTFDVYSPDGRIASIGNQGSLDTFYMNIGFVSGNVFNSQEYSKTTHNIAWVHIVIASGYTCDNLTLYPMIRKADIEDDTYEPYHAPVTTPIYLPEQLRMVGDEAEYIDYAEQKMHRIGADDINVTLPALSTIKGTNTFSVNTSIQPSNIYIKDSFDYKKVFTATRTIEGESPLNYRSIEDSDSTLKNYRIYGNTVDGESVGDRTANLFDENYPDIAVNTVKYISLSVENGEYTISTNMPLSGSASLFLLSGAVISGASTNDNGVWLEHNQTVTVSDNFITIGYRIYSNVAPRDYSVMLNSGSTPLPYEPYGYRVPVTVEGKNLVTSYLVETSGGNRFYPVVFAEVNLQPNTEYLITFTVHENGVKLYSNDLLFTSVYYSSEIQGKQIMRLKTKTSIQPDQHINNKGWVLLRNAIQNPSDFTITDVKLQLVSDAPIYLPEQLRMVGTEADYIDYGEQKLHRVRKNLWDGEIESGSWLGFNDDEPYKVDYNLRCRSSKLIAVKNSSVYTISNHEPSTNVQVIVQYRDNNKKFINEYGWADFPCTFTTPSNAAFIEFIIRKPSNLEIMPEDCGDIQLELGSTATEYEPYIESTDLDVTLPALPTLAGTNVLSVGTEVQPSGVEIKGHIK